MGDAGKQIEATGVPRAQLNRSIPEKDRMSREELIRDRRFPVVDREKGIVMAFGFFDHSGTVTPTSRTPNSFMMSESFQIDKGKIDQVEAVMASAPYKMRNEVRKEGDRRVNPIGVPTGK